MKFTIAFFLMVGFFVMNAQANEQETDRLDYWLNQLFSKLAESEESGITIKDGTVRVAEHVLSITPVPETVTKHQGQFVSATRFEVSIDSKPLPGLIYGAVGLGESAEDASKTAVVEWYMGFGKAIISAYSGQEPTHADSGVKYYAGSLGIRGEHPGGWLKTDQLHSKVIQSLAEELPKKQLIFGLAVNVAVTEGRVNSVQVLIDGQESADAARIIQNLDWPTNTTYIFKQAYVVKQESE